MDTFDKHHISRASRLSSFLMFFCVSMLTSFILFQNQSEKLFGLSKKGLDNIDWTFFQIERSYEAFEDTLVIGERAGDPDLPSKLALKWDLFCSAHETAKGPSFYFLLDYSPKSRIAVDSTNELKRDFLKIGEAIAVVNSALAQSRTPWGRDSVELRYMLKHYEDIAEFTKNVSMRANQRSAELSADKQQDVDSLQAGIVCIYFSQVFIILLFTLWGVVQIKSAKKAAAHTVKINSDLEKSNSALEKSKNKLMAAFKERNFFIAKSAHELRTPLNSILGFLELASDKSVDCSTRELYLAQAADSASHLKYLTEDILDYAKVDSVPVTCDSLVLEDMLEASLSLLQAQIQQSELKVIIDESILAKTVWADPVRIKQIFTNLISNALKYAVTGKKLEISVLRHTADSITIRFRDFGPGIDSQLKQLLFTPFTRGGSLDSNIPGTGIGLSTALKLVQSMGGDLTFEEGAPGCCFDVKLSVSNSSGSESKISPGASNACVSSEESVVRTLTTDLSGVIVLAVLDSLCLHSKIAKMLVSTQAQYLFVKDWDYVADVYSADNGVWVVTDQQISSELRIKYSNHLICLQSDQDLHKLNNIKRSSV